MNAEWTEAIRAYQDAKQVEREAREIFNLMPPAGTPDTAAQESLMWAVHLVREASVILLALAEKEEL